MKKICVIGLWHLGLVNTVGFAEVGYQVIGLDFNKKLIHNLQKVVLPLYEPGLEEKISIYLKLGRIHFTADIQSIKGVDAFVIAYDSIVDNKDKVDIAAVVNAIEKVAPFLAPETSLIITSQVPLGTSERMMRMIKRINTRWRSSVVYVPENLRLGNGLACFLKPEMLVFGVDTIQAKEAVLALYKPFKTKKFIMDLRSAEMVKHALNTFLATAIAFGNEIAHLCDRLGADAVVVSSALAGDARVGKAPIFPGLGFSGGTLARDLQQLIKYAKEKRYRAFLLKSIIQINEGTFTQIVIKLTQKLRNLKDKKIGLLGLTYKPGTSTLRCSPAIKLIKLLIKKKAICYAYDPKADVEEIKLYSALVEKVDTIDELAKKTDVLVLLTEWPEFRKINFTKIASYMRKPIIIDAKNYLNPMVVKKSGWIYEGYGRKK